MKTLRLFVGLSLFTLNMNGQTNCDCKIFPQPNDECLKYCKLYDLKFADEAKLQKAPLNLDAQTAKAIAQTPKRESFTQITDFKGKIPDAALYKITLAISGTKIQQNSGGINQQGDHNTIIINYPLPGRDQTTGDNPDYRADPEGMVGRNYSIVAHGLKVTLRRFVLRGFNLVGYMTLENVSPEASLTIGTYRTDMKVVDEAGNVYKSQAITIGNQSAIRYAYFRYQLYKGVRVDATVEFVVGNTNMRTLSVFEFFNDNPFRNIPLNATLN